MVLIESTTPRYPAEIRAIVHTPVLQQYAEVKGSVLREV